MRFNLRSFFHDKIIYLSSASTTKSYDRVFSSVGLERYLDRVEVGGSNPSTPTGFPSNWKPFSFPEGKLLIKIQNMILSVLSSFSNIQLIKSLSQIE